MVVTSQAEKKVADFWPVRPRPQHQKLVYLLRTVMDYVNNQLYLLLSPIMGRNKPYKRQTRHFTPPPALQSSEGQVKTPQRSGVLYAKLFAQELGIKIPSSVIRKVTGVAEHIQSRILALKEPRTLHNQPNPGPDPRGRKRAILRSDSAAISDYLSNDSTPFDDKSKPWLDIAEDAGITLPVTTHFKPPGLRTINPETIR